MKRHRTPGRLPLFLTGRRIICFCIGHSRRLRLQLQLFKKNNRVDYAAYCARCGKHMPKRIVAAHMTVGYHRPKRMLP